MPDGLYRPYFHGELVVEYRKSIASRKPSINDLEAQNHIQEEYQEPGTLRTRNLCYTQPERLDLIGYYVTISNRQTAC